VYQFLQIGLTSQLRNMRSGGGKKLDCVYQSSSSSLLEPDGIINRLLYLKPNCTRSPTSRVLTMSNNSSSSLAGYESLLASLPLTLTLPNIDITTLLAGLGLASLSYNAYRLLAAAAVYFLPSRLQIYHHGSEPYALVTGASDGIGLAGWLLLLINLVRWPSSPPY